MRPWWRAGVLAAAGVAALLAGCGIRVVSQPGPAPAATRTGSPAAATASSAPATSLRVSAPPSAAASPAWTPQTAASPVLTPQAAASPESPSSPRPAPSSDSSQPSPPSEAGAPQPSPATPGPHSAALAAAARRVAAGAAVRSVAPLFAQLASDLVARSGVPGAAVAVVAGDTVMERQFFGLRRIGRPEPVDSGTLFQVGPVSQAYTTTLLAALAGDGEIGWGEPVRRVWPEFRLRDPWASREATFIDLTGARSGLPAYAGTELRAFGYSRAEILRRLRYLRPEAGFRSAWAPQDALVTAAAEAAARATGEPWARMVRARVLEPIGATSTVVSYRAFATAADAAAPHRLVNGSMAPQRPADQDVFAPSLGVGATLDDVVAFARLQLNGGALGGARVAPADQLAPTLRPATAVAAGPAGPVTAGLGWELTAVDGRLLASAEGGLASGFSAVVSLLPDDGVAVVVLSNAYPEGVALGRSLTRALVDCMVFGAPQGDWLGLAEDELRVRPESPEAGGTSGLEVAGPAAAGVALPASAPAGAQAPRSRRVYAGVYEDAYYGRVTVRPGPGDGLSVLLGRGVTLRCVPWSGDVWRAPSSGAAVVFSVRASHARVLTLTQLTFDGRRGRFVRVR